MSRAGAYDVGVHLDALISSAQGGESSFLMARTSLRHVVPI